MTALRSAPAVRIAPIALAHAEGFHACLDAVAREKRWLAQTAALPLERIRGFVTQSVADDAVQFVALATGPAGDEVVGWADIFPAWADGVRHIGTLGMGVRADQRGRGLGRQLLASCLVKAALKGMTRIELSVRADNQPAIRLYESLGFAPEGRKRHGHRIDGVYADTLSMSLLLDEPADDGDAASATGTLRCALCGSLNHCAMAGGSHAGCWCATTTVPPALLARVPDALRGVSCICPRCVARAHLAESLTP